MADDLFALDAAQVARLRRILEQVEAGFNPVQQHSPKNLLSASQQVFGVLDSPIAASTALIPITANSGTLNVYSASSTGVFDSGFDETVYSVAPSIATTDRFCVCGRDAISGRLILHTQFCS